MNTYTKLNNGSWGVRAEGKPTPGVSILITKRDGTTEPKTIAAVLWTGTDKSGHTISLCSLVQASSRRGSFERGVCSECEANQDMGDMQGCPKHRGNPRC